MLTLRAGAVALGTTALVAACAPAPACAQSSVFTATGVEQTFVVPDGVTSLQITAQGAAGGSGAGGHGGTVDRTVTVLANSLLFVEVGVSPSGGSGGFPDGGDGSFGGGGSSDVRTCSLIALSCAGGISGKQTRLIVAGGGGGAGVDGSGGTFSSPGGAGGVAAVAGTAGSSTSDGTYTAGGGLGGGAGSDVVGGGGGAGGAPDSNDTMSGADGLAGGPGQFGRGGTSPGAGDGGGGGGGYYGGGAGGAGASDGGSEQGAGGGGGGGSNYAPGGVIGAPSASTQGSVTISWTNPAPPAALLTAHSQPTASSVTLTGTVDPHGATVTACHFAYGRTASLGSSAPCTPTVPAPSGGPVAAQLTSLSGHATYFYELVVTTAYGTATAGPATFATPASRPSISGQGASAVTTKSASLHATVAPGGLATNVVFQLGATTGYGVTTSPLSVAPDAAPTLVVAAVLKLRPGTLYHARALASNSLGGTPGPDFTFRTAKAIQCAVPKLKGDTLRQARRALARAHCRLGKVSRPKHSKAHAKLRVAGQSRKAHKRLPAGTRVGVRLAAAR